MNKVKIINISILVIIVSCYFSNKLLFVIPYYNVIVIALGVLLIVSSVLELLKIQAKKINDKYSKYPYRINYIFHGLTVHLFLSLPTGLYLIIDKEYYLAGFLIVFAVTFRLLERLIKFQKDHYCLLINPEEIISNEDEEIHIKLNNIDSILDLGEKFKFSMNNDTKTYLIKLSRIEKALQTELKTKITTLQQGLKHNAGSSV